MGMIVFFLVLKKEKRKNEVLEWLYDGYKRNNARGMKLASF